jgi:glycosyltransferase involved in cell wall biosynthesis
MSGGSRAGADFLNAILAPQVRVTAVCRDRVNATREVGGHRVPEVLWIQPPPLAGALQYQTHSLRSLAGGLMRDARARVLRHQLERALRRRHPSLVVHNGFPVPGSINDLLFRRFAHRLLLVHSSPEACDYFRRRNPGLSRDSVVDHLRLSRSIVFVSHQIRDAWLNRADIPRERTHVISNTTRELDIERARLRDPVAIRRELGIPEDAFLMVCVGKVDVAKGQDVLIEALPRVMAARTDAHLLLLGIMTPFGQVLPTRAEELGLIDRIHFLGQRRDAYDLIHAADLLVHPSRAEGQGLVILEAMALRTPVVAANVGGVPSCIQHGQSGWLVEPENPDQLAGAILELAARPGLRDALVEAASERYWRLFSTATQHQKTRHLIDALLSRDSTSLDSGSLSSRRPS